jgi:NAD(P)-dependent dehydrogenase (short-subunit alcohol dehydrogenase family)
MTLDADEFIRRFLIHVLPDGFHRIRHYGLGARNAAERAAERGITVAEYQAEAARPPQHQRQRDLPRRHPDRADARIPIGRANQPEDIAAMAVFLASPGARNITGQAYNVDGGLVPS